MWSTSRVSSTPWFVTVWLKPVHQQRTEESKGMDPQGRLRCVGMEQTILQQPWVGEENTACELGHCNKLNIHAEDKSADL